ncbi:SGNH/GDSL hydrolase family protein [Streptomyces sp. NPDC008079]|uniref:SGNH/GDSL hydrolase family protein n=1 Tax=Streptomyces sp. NPDC008079 TaxID=3364806 RepID=UPI0036E16684
MSGSSSGGTPGRAMGRRALLLAGAASAAAAGAGSLASAEPAHARPGGPGAEWVGSWAGSPNAAPTAAVVHLENQTVRHVLRLSLGGSALRLRLTNEFGESAASIGEVRVARRAGTQGTAIVPATDRRVTFGGSGSVLIPAGAPAVSDPVDLALPGGADLVVSLYLPERTAATSLHAYALQKNAVAAGNVTGATTVTPTAEPQAVYLVSGVSVRAGRQASAIVALGDSITDGGKSTVGADLRWPDQLAARLRSARPAADRAVVNAGISGNRLLHDPNPPAGDPAEAYALNFGPSALRRFDRDVLAQPAAAYVITLIGVNDLGHPGTVAPLSETVTAEQLIAGHGQLAARAHAAGLIAIGGTIMPFKDDTFGFWSQANGEKRNAVNDWIRTSGAYDAVIDFARVTADPADPDKLAAAYSSGDGLHPNDAGHTAMAAAVPLDLFR